MKNGTSNCALAGLAVGAALAATGAAADPVADFYKGRTVTITVGYAPAASYDLYARLLSRHIGRHIPGKPNVIVQNMPGGSSLKAANYMYKVAPKDGANLGVIRNGMALEPLYGRPGIKFDALKFNWVGSLTRITGGCTVWHTAPGQTIDDAKKQDVVAGAIGTQGSIAVYPRALNDMLGTRFKVVLGYTSAGILHAMEQGEVHARCGGDWHSLAASHPDWIREGKIRLIAQMTNKKALPDKPWIFDYVKKPEDVQALRLIFATQDWGQPVIAPPDVPKERIAALRKAFDNAMKDKALLAEAEKTKLRIDDPMGGEEIQRLLEGYYKTPKAVVDRVAGYGSPARGERTLPKKGKKKAN